MFTLFNDPIGNLLGSWSTEINIWSSLLKIFISIILGAVIGCERSNKRHAAGLRTFIMVSLASTIIMLIESVIAENSQIAGIISAAAIIGISIISANTILYSSRSQIKGLTTSIGLWAAGVLGLLIGTGYYTIVIICFVAYLLTLSIFPLLEIYLKNRSNHFEIHLELKNANYLQNFVATIRELGLKIDDIETNPAYISSGLSVYSISISITSKELKKYKTHAEIIAALKTLDYVYYIEEM